MAFSKCMFKKYLDLLYLNVTKCKFRFGNACINFIKYQTRETEIDHKVFPNKLHKYSTFD